MQRDGAVALAQRGTGALGHDLGIEVLEEAGVGGQRGLGRRAQERVQGLVRGLGGDVPERNVEAGDREQGDAIAAEQVKLELDLLHQRRDIVDVAADDDGGHHVGHGGTHGAAAIVAEGLAKAGDARVGLDPHDDHVEALPGSAAPARGPAAVAERDGDGNGVDAGDSYRHLSAHVGERCRGGI